MKTLIDLISKIFGKPGQCVPDNKPKEPVDLPPIGNIPGPM